MGAIDYINSTVDAIHRFTNFELLYNKNTNSFRFAPYYDHGQSFLNTDATLSKTEYTKY